MTAKKLTTLSEAQLARLPEIRDEWLAIGLSTAPLDFEKAIPAAIDAYRAADLKPPTEFYRFQSPIAAAFGALLIQGLDSVPKNVLSAPEPPEPAKRAFGIGPFFQAAETQLGKQAKIPLTGAVLDHVWGELLHGGKQAFYDQVLEQVSAQVYGSQDASWLGFYAAFAEFGIEEAKRLAPLGELARHCGWWAPYEDIVIFQDRPNTIRFDDEKRLHCETGPAISYPDGLTEIHAWHGVVVPKVWIEDKPSLTGQMALAVSNLEQRRAACEIVGWENILQQLNAVTIDKNADPQIGELVEVNLPDSGRERFLRVTCSTGRKFALAVPGNMKTALMANAWTYGMEDDLENFKIDVRT